jgi:hypothetical protein
MNKALRAAPSSRWHHGSAMPRPSHQPGRVKCPSAPARTMRLPDVASLRGRVFPLPHLFEIVLSEAGVYIVRVPIHLDEEESPVRTW